MIKTNILYNGDCINILNKKIDAESINLIFADPPYNLSGNGLKWIGNKTGGDWYMVNEKWDKMTSSEYLKFTRKWLGACDKVLKRIGSIYVSCSYHNIGEVLITLKQLDYKINNIITWFKTNAMPNMTHKSFTHSSEFIVYAVKNSGWLFNYETVKVINPNKKKDGTNKQMRDVWEMPLVQGNERIKLSDGKTAHPTQKPIEMLKRIILASSNENDIVLDPFLGSGTTCFVAKQYNRKYIGIEMNKTYFDIAVNRINPEYKVQI
jgi:site-specific DNA-methyltransferase (adenine-specific)/modification methylase